MDRLDHLLVIVGEEASEVAKESAKCLRFGAHEVYPEIGISNVERLLVEFNELYALMEMMASERIIREDFLDRTKIDAKKLKVEKLLLYSAECGRLASGATQVRK